MRTWEEAAENAAESIPHLPVGDEYVDHIDRFLDELKADSSDEDWFRFIADEALSAHGGHRRIVTERVLYMIAQKQHDYGHDNVLWGGIEGVVLRMHDKTARIRNLVARGRDPKHEALADSWLDLIGYSIIGIMLVRGTFELPLHSDLPVPERVGEYAIRGDAVVQDAPLYNTFLDASGDEVESDSPVFDPSYEEWLDEFASIPEEAFDDADTYDELYDHTLMHFETASQHVFVGVYPTGWPNGEGGKVGIFTRGKNKRGGEAVGAYFTVPELRSLVEYLDKCHDVVQAHDIFVDAPLTQDVVDAIMVLTTFGPEVVITPEEDA
jgi:hypothetical protein